MDLQQRIGGKLPEIDIAGMMFFVDVRLRELRADYGLRSKIDLDKLETGPDGESYRFAFNTETKRMVDIDKTITEWPDDVIIIEIPGDVKLDPYSVARKKGIDPVAFVKVHPIKRELKAKVIPLSETGLPSIMERNKQVKEQKLLTKLGGPGRKNKGNRIQ
jgi:hypothetical protein